MNEEEKSMSPPKKEKKKHQPPKLSYLVGVDGGYGDFGMNHILQFQLHAWVRYFRYQAVLELSMQQKSVC